MQRQATLATVTATRPATGPGLATFKASYLTHELRAPLTSVRSALNILADELKDRLQPDERQMLAIAIKNSERLGGLINDILDYSKLQGGGIQLEPKPCTARDLLQEAVDSLQAWALTKGVKLLRVESEEAPPQVQADPGRTAQVLVNLLSNAIKFTPRGGRVEVSAKPGSGRLWGQVVFSVKDSGCGIRAEDLSRVFNVFETSAATGRKGEGTGLGLTLAKSFVELQGGKIWAESWHGHGSTFRFTLPVAASEPSFAEEGVRAWRYLFPNLFYQVAHATTCLLAAWFR